MILGIGTDLANIERIQRSIDRFGDRFTHRVFTAAERAYAARRKDQASTFAKRFAAKEACLKALGTGLIQGFAWHDMEIVNDEAGCPSIALRGRARQRLQQITPPGHGTQLHLSMTDDHPWAQAFVIVEARPAPSSGRASP